MKQCFWNRLDLFFPPFEVTSMHRLKNTVFYHNNLLEEHISRDNTESEVVLNSIFNSLWNRQESCQLFPIHM